MKKRIGDWVSTFSGKQFYPLDPRAEDVCIDDIAHALSMICRFDGHCREFYSVAEHCQYVAKVASNSAIRPERIALLGLLHDAAEAYLLDVVRPLKRTPEMAWYAGAEARVMSAIYESLNVDPPTAEESERISTADDVMLHTEALALTQWVPSWKPAYEFRCVVLECKDPHVAKYDWLNDVHRMQWLGGGRRS